MSADPISEPEPLDPEVILTVDYENKTIGVSDEAVRIYYAVKGSGKPENPRQVRWVVLGLRGKDQLFIRPKEGHSKGLFNPVGEGTYKLFWPHIAAESGPPFDPFKNTGADEVEWHYEIEVQSQGAPAFGVDPVVFIERDG